MHQSRVVFVKKKSKLRLGTTLMRSLLKSKTGPPHALDENPLGVKSTLIRRQLGIKPTPPWIGFVMLAIDRTTDSSSRTID